MVLDVGIYSPQSISGFSVRNIVPIKEANFAHVRNGREC